ncbi:MAG: nickel pincer cofactor biosynthesis protein LarB [Candidatus Methanosuratincola sp.]
MELRKLLYELSSGKISVDEAEQRIRLLAIREMEIACLDLSREARKGVPEIVLAEGKDDASLKEIVKAFLGESGKVIITRINEERLEALKSSLAGRPEIKYSAVGRVAVISNRECAYPEKRGAVSLITAGTADIRVAEEAKFVLEEMRCTVHSYYDVGIAGLHRVFPAVRDSLDKDVDAIIVFAGMEGALASVISSLVPVPVIGVPTSSGYGFGGRGEGALTAMLQSCSPGLVVVNIDNGVGAAVAAALISRMRWKSRNYESK